MRNETEFMKKIIHIEKHYLRDMDKVKQLFQNDTLEIAAITSYFETIKAEKVDSFEKRMKLLTDFYFLVELLRDDRELFFLNNISNDLYDLMEEETLFEQVGDDHFFDFLDMYQTGNWKECKITLPKEEHFQFFLKLANHYRTFETLKREEIVENKESDHAVYINHLSSGGYDLVQLFFHITSPHSFFKTIRMDLENNETLQEEDVAFYIEETYFLDENVSYNVPNKIEVLQNYKQNILDAIQFELDHNAYVYGPLFTHYFEEYKRKISLL